MKLQNLKFVTLCCCLFAAHSATAIEINAEQGWRFGINGFVDTQYMYSDAMPSISGVVGSPTINEMGAISNLSQEHLNLLVSGQKNNMSFLINLDSHPPISAVHIGAVADQIRLAEAYGEASFGDGWRLRGGHFNAPFSMLNEVAYVIPLFSSVHLPLMYLMPHTYHGGQDGIADSASVRHNLMPGSANLMVSNTSTWGVLELDIDLYLTSGEASSDQHQLDENTNNGLGTRVQINHEDELFVLGLSMYTVNNDGVGKDPLIEDVGDELLMGLDAAFPVWQDRLNVEFEWVYNEFSARQNRTASSLRLLSPVGDATLLFFSYQYMRDDAHPIFFRGMDVYSLGGSYNWSTNMMFKVEYHDHQIRQDDHALVLPEETFSMIKSSLSFMF